VNGLEVALAAVFAALGVRSLVHWLRRPMASDARRDHLLFALFVVSRAGLWFALAGLFLIYAGLSTRGRALLDDVARLRWYLVVLLVPAALQFVTGFLLARGRDRSPQDRADGPAG
jgi:hypothetical protein